MLPLLLLSFLLSFASCQQTCATHERVVWVFTLICVFSCTLERYMQIYSLASRSTLSCCCSVLLVLFALGTSGVQMDVLKEMWVAHATGSVNLVRCVFSWTKCLGSEELAQTQFVLRKVSKLSSTGWRFVVALSFVWKSAFTRILLAASCLELLDYVGWSTCKVWGDNVWCGSSCVPARVRMLAIGLLRLARILSTNCKSQPVNIRAFQCWKSQTVPLRIGCRVSVVMFAR